ncbi:hypothetical protein [Methylocella sp.]|uniref:hypothetical protein n=1 Tax=Methylocella sp. TaxID=1978226 RepID=UPI00378328FE
MFGHDTSKEPSREWAVIVKEQRCPFVEKRCYKVRKSQPEISIGTCTVKYGNEPIIICPLRLLERRQIFVDCLHLLTGHEPGNELHIVPEISVPGGSIDYMLASVRAGKVRDFVGIELQTLDTTGTVWPERQRFLESKDVVGLDAADLRNPKSYGMNWKMTAKTILVQLHHKIQTFEGVNKHLVLVLQDRLLDYMGREFSFQHISQEARTSDPMHFHAYAVKCENERSISLVRRVSTDAVGIAMCRGLQSEAKLDLQVILMAIEQRITTKTRFDFQQPPLPVSVELDQS